MEEIRQFVAIALTLALLVTLLWWLRRTGIGQLRLKRQSASIEIIESRALCAGHALHLVRVTDRVLALATHPGGCTLLESGLPVQTALCRPPESAL